MLSASEEHAGRWRSRGLPPCHPNFQHSTSTSQTHTRPAPPSPLQGSQRLPRPQGSGAREGKSVRRAPEGGRPPSRLAEASPGSCRFNPAPGLPGAQPPPRPAGGSPAPPPAAPHPSPRRSSGTSQSQPQPRARGHGAPAGRGGGEGRHWGIPSPPKEVGEVGEAGEGRRGGGEAGLPEKETTARTKSGGFQAALAGRVSILGEAPPRTPTRRPLPLCGRGGTRVAAPGGV